MLKFNAQLDRIVAVRDKPKTKTDGGILLADVSIEHPLLCTIVAVGPKASESFKVGDRVLIAMQVTREHEMPDGNMYVFTSPENILSGVTL